MKIKILATSLAAISAFLGGYAAYADTLTEPCRVGLYHLSDGRDVDIDPADAGHLRWRLKNGTSGKLTREADGSWSSTLGWAGRPDGIHVSFGSCSQGRITFNGVSGKRDIFDIQNVTFAGAGDVPLAGRLVLPKGRGPVPIVVLVHGAERMSALQYYSLQRLFPSDGIGVFVYDKRGTGASGGEYTQDYTLLARDAVAAVAEVRTLAGSRVGRVGFQAGSQGGWVAPLAATLTPVDFIVVSFGLAVSPLAEDREAIALNMTNHGYGPDVMQKAMEVADATAAILTSKFQAGYKALAAVQAKYRAEPWFKNVRGDVTWFILKTPEAKLRKIGPELLRGVNLDYDPLPVLHKLETPQLWVFGAEDRDAPYAETLRRLDRLVQGGKPIVTAVFPKAEHGIYEYETTADGERLSTRNSDGYYAMMRDYILTGHLSGRYGKSVVAPPR
ncbi:alpha/beta hydrolase family protein [Kordiimonas marina]|uniref:alpha/beta hydrolase family protein n=1 Tax=Kordiimonas marina TaxID=2872312 RepID=UPI001FF18A6F|nr:prolyl oligopeptidase family serine peptidase [Kordiimonas marina]MCJ9428917.1 prolyl oligopeptidase family serine peptidase [Kordiimonas marina]